MFFQLKEVVMPRGDGTGPAGVGRMTGRGAGYCAGYGMPGFANNPGGGFGFGRGCGRGFGMGWRNGRAVPYYEPFSTSVRNERDALKEQARYLENALGSVNKRIENLEKESQ